MHNPIPKSKHKKPKKGKGATARKSKDQHSRKGRFFIKFLCWLVIFPAILVWSGLKVDWAAVHEKVTHIAKKPVETISIQGDFEFIEKSVIQQIVSQALDGNFVDLNLVALKNEIEKNSWVQEVNLKRVWPSSLNIEVVEQKPIARWDTVGFLNQYGELIITDIGESLHYLPRLIGDTQLSNKMARMYLDMAMLLSKYDLKIRDLKVDDKRSWNVVLKSGHKLVLGEGDLIIKLKNFLYIYDIHLREHFELIKKIDMRYENGLAVAWKENANNI